MSGANNTHQNEIQITKLEGVIREEFAKMSGKFDMHTQRIENVSNSLSEGLKRLEKHIEDSDLHKCVEHDSDINNAFKELRKFETKQNKLVEDISRLNENQQVLKGQVRVLKWVAGFLVGLVGIGREVILWVMKN